jgi:hypothetical protein
MFRSVTTTAVMLFGLFIMSSSAQDSKQITIAGKVQNADNMALKGAQIVLSFMGTGTETGTEIGIGIGGEGGPGTPTGDTIYTDTLGNFTLLKDSSTIANAMIIWFVSLDGYDSKNGTATFGGSDTISIGIVTLNVAGTSKRITHISGVVVDSANNPISGALVILTSGGGIGAIGGEFGAAGVEDSVLTNSSGAFSDSILLDTTSASMGGLMVSWKVSATGFSSREGDADAASDTVALDTILLKKTATPLLAIISGVIVDDLGAPIDSAAIGISSVSSDISDMMSRNATTHTIYSKVDGSFSDSISVDTTYGLQLTIMWTVSMSGYTNCTGETQILNSVTSLDTIVMTRIPSAIRVASRTVLKTKANSIRITSLNGRLLWQGKPDALKEILANHLFFSSQPVMITYLNNRTVLQSELKQIQK